MLHRSATPAHYDIESRSYDAFNERDSRVINGTVERILGRHGVATVLDLTCGTGSQAFWLAARGFEVTGLDFSARMLALARRKARDQGVSIRFLKGDVRTSRMGSFDAVITISNAVGHLTRADFERAIRNIRDNLKAGGVYVFDIFNRSCLTRAGVIARLTIDRVASAGGRKVREIQYSVLEDSGVLASHTTYLVQRGSGRPRVSRSWQTLQIYTAAELRSLLRGNGFDVVRQCGIDGSRFSERNSERVLTIA